MRGLVKLLWVVGLLVLCSRAGAAPAVGWQFVVTMADMERGVFDVKMTMQGLSGEVRLCQFMVNTEPELTDIRRVGPGPAVVFDDGCWNLAGAEPGGTTVSYKYDLKALGKRKGQPDYAESIGSTYLFNDQAVLLHPSPLPPHAAIEVEFRLPSGVPLVAPWSRLPGPGHRYRFDSEQHDGGVYIGLGSLLSELEPVKVGKSAGRLFLVNLPFHSPPAAPRAWIAEALAAAEKFYGELLSREVFVYLVPVSGTDEAGVFGTVLRRGTPSVVMYFGADCQKLRMQDDWVATHEIFHTGNPTIKGRIPWLIEGFTTYYQDVLRARAGALSEEATWGDLYDGFHRFCQPEGGASLSEESQQLFQTHRYTRLYWGGACLAFVADMAIRTRTGGKRSLDDVLLRLRKESMNSPMTEDEIVAVLDAEAGNHLASRTLRERKAVPLGDLYRRLGIEPTGPKSVKFNDSAPQAATRKAILGR